jgi:ornithine carbamoyltransferase
VKKDFIDILDLDEKEMFELFDLAKKLKDQPVQSLWIGRTLGLLFTKSSTRTRVSFEVGAFQLGGHAIYLDTQALQIARGEPLSDTAKVLSRYLDAIVIRTYQHQELIEFAENASIPVINGLTDDSHPCQIICDLFTIFEKRSRLKDLKVVYIGDGANNMAHTWILGAAMMGMKLVIAAPPKYWPNPEIIRRAVKLSALGQSFFEVTQDVASAVREADVLYTDVWVSMGQESENEKRLKDLKGYQINEALLKSASKDVLVMHCLPAHRGEEISAEVIDGTKSIVFDQAENRLHTQKALLLMLTKNGIVSKKN